MPSTDQGMKLSESERLSVARWLVLSRKEGMTPSVLARLFRQYGSSEAVFASDALSKFEISHLKSEIEDTTKQLLEFSADGIRTIAIESDDYPAGLLDLRSPPVVLFVSGEVTASDQRAIAIVGTRTPSREGRLVARELARQAVAAGYCVVSGLARGIDTEAHQAALLAGGRTIAILGNGLASIYPAENAPLAARIKRRGALISEVWPTASVSRPMLLARDRLQSAMSLVVVVVQTHLGCGSLVTAKHAIECKRPLYAIRWDEAPYTIGLSRLRQIGAIELDVDAFGDISGLLDTTTRQQLPLP
jgi:DNA processing protein